MLVWESLQETDKVLAANLSTAFALTSASVEDEMELNDRMARCLIDSVASGELQEDSAIAILIDWKKARKQKPEVENESAGT